LSAVILVFLFYNYGCKSRESIPFYNKKFVLYDD
jgi:hypothetical protein